MLFNLTNPSAPADSAGAFILHSIFSEARAVCQAQAVCRVWVLVAGIMLAGVTLAEDVATAEIDTMAGHSGHMAAAPDAKQEMVAGDHAHSENSISDEQQGSGFERRNALEISQGAIGALVGDYRFFNAKGEMRSLSDFHGKPLVISLIYTSCYHICPTTTQHLAKVVKKARDVLGDSSFSVVTIGFDTKNDTADAMRIFARQQSVGLNDWEFLSADQKTIDALTKDLGFLYFPDRKSVV